MQPVALGIQVLLMGVGVLRTDKERMLDNHAGMLREAVALASRTARCGLHDSIPRTSRPPGWHLIVAMAEGG